jgi:hypothetical protein
MFLCKGITLGVRGACIASAGAWGVPSDFIPFQDSSLQSDKVTTNQNSSEGYLPAIPVSHILTLC